MVRSWIRQALRASGVAILVPAAVVAAIALSVLGGGSDVGSLGEVLRGPAVPPAEAAQPPPRPRRAPFAPAARATHHDARAPRRTAAQRRVAPPPVQTLPVGSPHPHRPAPQPTVSAPAPAPAPAPAAPAPAPSRPHPIHDVGAQAAATLRPLPLAGPAAADAVQAVVDLVDPA